MPRKCVVHRYNISTWTSEPNVSHAHHGGLPAGRGRYLRCSRAQGALMIKTTQSSTDNLDVTGSSDTLRFLDIRPALRLIRVQRCALPK